MAFRKDTTTKLGALFYIVGRGLGGLNGAMESTLDRSALFIKAWGYGRWLDMIHSFRALRHKQITDCAGMTHWSRNSSTSAVHHDRTVGPTGLSVGVIKDTDLAHRCQKRTGHRLTDLSCIAALER